MIKHSFRVCWSSWSASGEPEDWANWRILHIKLISQDLRKAAFGWEPMFHIKPTGSKCLSRSEKLQDHSRTRINAKTPSPLPASSAGRWRGLELGFHVLPGRPDAGGPRAEWLPLSLLSGEGAAADGESSAEDRPQPFSGRRGA